MTIPVVKVNHAIEEEGSTRGARESGANEFVSVSQYGIARGARKQTQTPDVLKKYTTHRSLREYDPNYDH